METALQYEHVTGLCRNVFQSKLRDYGPSWRIMRPQSITDQLFIKANRIRNIEVRGVTKVNEGIQPEFIAIVNYGVIGLIQLTHGAVTDAKDMTVDEALTLYDNYLSETKALMLAKNHDYDEAWRSMRISSYTDMILTKLNRVKQIEDNHGQTIESEGIDANYMDIINYALFGLIKLAFNEGLSINYSIIHNS